MLTRTRKLIGPTAFALAFVAALPLASAVAPPANQAPAPPANQPADKNTDTKQNDHDGVLSGPKVDPNSNTDKDGPGLRRGERGERGPREGLPFQAWYRVVQTLDLNDEQKTKSKAIADEFQGAVQAFEKEHGEKMRELQGQIREARQSGNEPPKELAKSMQEIRALAPKPEGYQKRVWELLNPTQQATLKTKLDAAREEMMKRRGQGRPGGPDGPRPGGEPGMAPPPPPPGGPDDKAPGNAGGDRARRRAEFLRSRQANPPPPPPPPKDPNTP